MSDKDLPREPPEDVRKKQDPEYSEADFRLDLFRVAGKKAREEDDEKAEEDVTPQSSEPD